MSASPYSDIAPLQYHRHLTLSSSPCCIIVPQLYHRPLTLISSLCCITVPLLCHRPSAVSASSYSDIVPHSDIVRLLSHRPPTLISSTHSDIVPHADIFTYYTSFPCCITVPLLCHLPPSVSAKDIIRNISLQSSHRNGNLISLLLHHIPLSENPFGQQGPY